MELLSEAGGTARLTVSGFSMVPLLCPGDVVVVRLGQVRPRLGDVVVRRQGDALVVHRVVQVTGEHIITKGDATLSHDPSVSSDEILGVVIAIEGDISMDLTRRAWRVLNPILAAYSRLAARVWWGLSVARQRLLPGRLPVVLRVGGRALRFALRSPLWLLARGVRRP
jgi:hypothetical protein